MGRHEARSLRQRLRLETKTCPNYPLGCTVKKNKFCLIASCAFEKGIHLCLECPEFLSETTKAGPIAFGYCQDISGKS